MIYPIELNPNEGNKNNRKILVNLYQHHTPIQLHTG